MDYLIGMNGKRLAVPDLTDPEKRVPYSTDWFMVFVRRRSTREVLPRPIILQAPSIDVAYRAVKQRIEHDGDLEIYHIKQRAPRPWPRWEVGLKQRWV